jgi:hypothetical protein
VESRTRTNGSKIKILLSQDFLCRRTSKEAYLKTRKTASRVEKEHGSVV